MINAKNFCLNNIKLDEKTYKNILIYYIGYVTIKYLKYLKIYSVNPLHLIFSNMNGYFEEINKSKYLTPFRMGFFGAAHRLKGGGGGPPPLKSVTHILQR